MPEVEKTHNFNSVYIFWIILFYNIFISNYHYIKIIVNSLHNFSFEMPISGVIIFINIVGIYLFLKNITFEINYKISYKNTSL